MCDGERSRSLGKAPERMDIVRSSAAEEKGLCSRDLEVISVLLGGIGIRPNEQDGGFSPSVECSNQKSFQRACSPADGQDLSGRRDLNLPEGRF